MRNLVFVEFRIGAPAFCDRAEAGVCAGCWKGGIHNFYIQGVFLTGAALKVLSVGDGKIPMKKVKVRICHREYVKF